MVEILWDRRPRQPTRQALLQRFMGNRSTPMRQHPMAYLAFVTCGLAELQPLFRACREQRQDGEYFDDFWCAPGWLKSRAYRVCLRSQYIPVCETKFSGCQPPVNPPASSPSDRHPHPGENPQSFPLDAGQDLTLFSRISWYSIIHSMPRTEKSTAEVESIVHETLALTADDVRDAVYVHPVVMTQYDGLSTSTSGSAACLWY